MLGIIVLILIGLFLFVVEFLLIPGVTLAGIGGVACIITGIVLAYAGYENPVGHITLVSTLAATFLTIGMALRAKTWSRFTLHTNIDGSVDNPTSNETFKPGDFGVSISRLTPMGKARINNIVVEAKSTGEFIDQKTEIEVIRIEGSKVIVKPKK